MLTIGSPFALSTRTCSDALSLAVLKAGKFSIVHYAGKVFYSVDGFVTKNSDQMSHDLRLNPRQPLGG